MNRKAFWLVSVFVLSAMLVLNLGYVQAQTQDQVAKFDAFGNLVDSAITETSGNVGIGTPTPQGKVDILVPNEGDLAFRLLSGPNAFLDVRPTNIGGQFQTLLDTVNTRDVVFGGGTRNVGIGTTNPTSKLHVAGRVLANGYDVPSDIRLKEDVTSLTGVLEKLEKVRGVSFKWNAQSEALGQSKGHQDVGVIAQEVAAVFPELVTTRSPENYQSVDYSKLTAVLLEAVKELKAENETLKHRIEALESK